MKTQASVLRLISVLVLTFTLLLPLASCDRSSDGPRRETPPDRPNGGKEDPPGGSGNSGGERPDPSDGSIDFAVEFRDASPRFVGSGVSLRFDRGGVLFKTLSDGRRQIIDLGGSATVDATLGAMRPDSVLSAPTTVSLNGRKLENLTVRMKKQTAEAVWYHVQAAGSEHGYILVLP